MNILIPVIIGAVGASVYKNHKKNSPNSRQNNINIKEEIKETPKTVDTGSASFNHLPLNVKEIASRIEANLGRKDLSAFHHNIKNLKITNKLDLFDSKCNVNKTVFESLYYPSLNKIYISNKCNNFSLSHEMLHLSSTRVNGRVAYCGFNQISPQGNVAVGINEGYTELLATRYFGDMPHKYTYITEQAYAGIVETLIGKNKMENLYLQSDLNGLMNALCSYYSMNDVQKFIKSVDIISKASTYGIDKVNRKSLDYALLFANTFAVNALEEKIRRSANDPDVMYKSRTLLKKALSGSYSLAKSGSEVKDELSLMMDNLKFMEPVRQRVYSKTRR